MKTIIYPSGKEIKVYEWEEFRRLQEKPKYGIVKAKNKSKEK